MAPMRVFRKSENVNEAMGKDLKAVVKYFESAGFWYDKKGSLGSVFIRAPIRVTMLLVNLLALIGLGFGGTINCRGQ